MVDRDFDRYEQNPDGSVTKTTYEQDYAVRSEHISRERLRQEYPEIDKQLPETANN